MPSAKAESVAGVGVAGRLRSRLCGCNMQQDSSGSTAAPVGPSSRQQKQGTQVAAGAAAGGATVAAGGSCRCLTVFPPPSLTLPPTAARAAVRERGGVAAGFAESLSPPSHTPPVSLHPPPATSPPPSRRTPLKGGVGRAAGNSHLPPPHLPPPTAEAAEGKGGAALAAAHAGAGDESWARDGLGTAGVFATVNGAFATGRTRDKAMTRDGAANGDVDDQRKSRRAGRRGLLPVGRDVTNLA
ncbi:unnamed protein product [Closterium sp. NIES-53]